MIRNKKIGEILLEVEFITKEQLNAALLHQKKTDPKKKLGEILLELGFLNELDLLRCLAGIFRIKYISSDKLSKMTIPGWIIDIIPLEFAEEHSVLPFFCYEKAKILSVVVPDPQDRELPKLIKRVSGYNEVERYLALESTIKAGITKYYKNDQTAFDRSKSLLKASSPGAIPGFIPKGQPAIDLEYLDSAEATFIYKDSPEGVPPGIVSDRVEPAERPKVYKKRLSDYVSSQSLMTENTFTEVLNVVINVLELYKGKKYEGHSANVAKMVREISINLNLKAQETYFNILAAYLHDCCMHSPEHLNLLNFRSKDTISLPQKYSKATDRVFEKARLPDQVQNILLHIFERYDGLGFPGGLNEKEIPLGSRIIATVDAFIHLMNFEQDVAYKNPYKNSFDAIKSLVNRYFDPDVVDALEDVIIDHLLDETSPQVIVINSNSEELNNLSMRLKKNGILPYPLTDTEEVMNILENNPVSFVISEVNINLLDGLSLCSAIKTNDKYKDINFIFLSEDKDSAAIGKGFGVGADDFMTKPYNPDVLIAKIQKILNLTTKKTEKIAEEVIHKKGLTGNLAEIQVTELIQMLFRGRKTGDLKFFRNEDKGEIFFKNGQVINSRYQELEGVEAFNLLMRWEKGNFTFDPDVELPEQKIHDGTEMLVIEACRIWDEESRNKEKSH